MTLETQRLIIKPLTYNQLVKYAQCDNSLEVELGLNLTLRTISSELKDALEQVILPDLANNPDTFMFHTLWTAILKKENKMVADVGIFGEPNDHGEIEIGYGTYDAFQGQGFMTEVVKAIADWAQNQPSVKALVASTEKENVASFRVLEKNDFIKIGETDTLFNWHLGLNK
jgi:[ribosomal protein S5]-alanine N-acetyltransferase